LTSSVARDRATRWAPGRVNLIGDHTDYNGGLALPFAIAQGTHVSIEHVGGAQHRVVSSQRDHETIESPVDADPSMRSGTWADYVVGCVWALRQAGVAVDGVEVSVDGNVPLGAGLASSASLTCATTLALLDMFGAQFTPLEVAQVARRAEVDFVGAPVGLMDQLVAIQATVGHLTLLDASRLTTEQVPFEPERSGRVVLLVDSGVRHRVPAGAYAERVASCREAAAALGVDSLARVDDLQIVDRLPDPVLRARARHVVTEDARVREVVVRLREGRGDEIGPLLLASHQSLRDEFEVSTPELELAVDTAMAAGADGARLTGAGFGGCVLVVAPVGRREALEASIRDAFGARGWPEPGVWSVRPGPGALQQAAQQVGEELSNP
jgi:galactokinase